MDCTCKRKRTILCFLLSLLFHITLLILLINPDIFFNPIKKLFKKEDTKKNQPLIPKPRELAALNPRKSEFGAPVVFEDDAQFPEELFDTLTDSELPQEGKPIPHTIVQNEPQQIITKPEIKNPEVKKPEPEKIVKAQIEEKKESIKKLQKNLLALIKKELKEKPKPKPEQKKVPEPIKEEKITPPIPKPPEQKRRIAQRSKGFEQKKAAPVDKKRLTFADLANGFLDTLKGDGQDWEKRNGNKNLRPDLQELKFLSYARKVAWYIQNSWKRYMRELDRTAPNSADISFILSIDLEGNLIGMQVTKYTGNYDLDTVIIKAVKNAAPFPPLPKHFKTNVLRFPSHWKYVREQVPGYRIG